MGCTCSKIPGHFSHPPRLRRPIRLRSSHLVSGSQTQQDAAVFPSQDECDHPAGGDMLGSVSCQSRSQEKIQDSHVQLKMIPGERHRSLQKRPSKLTRSTLKGLRKKVQDPHPRNFPEPHSTDHSDSYSVSPEPSAVAAGNEKIISSLLQSNSPTIPVAEQRETESSRVLLIPTDFVGADIIHTLNPLRDSPIQTEEMISSPHETDEPVAVADIPGIVPANVHTPLLTSDSDSSAHERSIHHNVLDEEYSNKAAIIDGLQGPKFENHANRQSISSQSTLTRAKNLVIAIQIEKRYLRSLVSLIESLFPTVEEGKRYLENVVRPLHEIMEIRNVSFPILPPRLRHIYLQSLNLLVFSAAKSVASQHRELRQRRGSNTSFSLSDPVAHPEYAVLYDEHFHSSAHDISVEKFLHRFSIAVDAWKFAHATSTWVDRDGIFADSLRGWNSLSGTANDLASDTEENPKLANREKLSCLRDIDCSVKIAQTKSEELPSSSICENTIRSYRSHSANELDHVVACKISVSSRHRSLSDDRNERDKETCSRSVRSRVSFADCVRVIEYNPDKLSRHSDS